MRGKEKKIKILVISGKIYLKYENEELIDPQIGDIMFYMHDDNRPKIGFIGNYFETGIQGYFKMDIFDGRDWNALSAEEFFDSKEHHFHKKELPIDCYNQCKDLLTDIGGTIVNYNYRGHYTTYVHQSGEYKGKKGHFDRKKKEKKL